VVLNAMECEPYITADDMLMRERAGRLLKAQILCNIFYKHNTLIIGIEDNKPQAINCFDNSLLKLTSSIFLATATNILRVQHDKRFIF
jgi:electron transport complex protein RnfC